MTKIAWMDPKAIRFITVHCTATPRGRPNTAEEVTQWDIDRFGQPSYHYVIELDGDVKQTLQHNQRGAHVGKANTGNIGISYVGGTEGRDAGNRPADTRTPEQTAALEGLIRRLLGLWPNAKIRGHRDWPGVPKACPSFEVRTWLQSVGLGAHYG